MSSIPTFRVTSPLSALYRRFDVALGFVVLVVAGAAGAARIHPALAVPVVAAGVAAALWYVSQIRWIIEGDQMLIANGFRTHRFAVADIVDLAVQGVRYGQAGSQRARRVIAVVRDRTTGQLRRVPVLASERDDLGRFHALLDEARAAIDPGAAADRRATVVLSAVQAHRGCVAEVSLAHLDGRTVRIEVPAGVTPESTMRVAGLGLPAEGNRRAGDLLVGFAVRR